VIPLIVFYVHIVAIAAVYTRRWQDEGFSEGILAVFFMALIFFVGWSMSSFVMKLIMNAEGAGGAFDRDSASLLLLTGAESVFYYFYIRGESRPAPPEDGPALYRLEEGPRRIQVPALSARGFAEGAGTVLTRTSKRAGCSRAAVLP